MLKALLASTVLLASGNVFAALQVGSPAPDFSLPSASGDSVSVKKFIGKTVVLEWTNPNCPFVKKFYDVGAMQITQQEAKDQGAVWLAINSSAKGKEGHVSPAEAAQLVSAQKIQASAYLVDADGTVGKLYNANNTPYIVVIDAKGNVAYTGAIDNVPSADSSDVKGATNYALSAVKALKAGKEPSPSNTQPYGCSVKYAN
jgi:peroxiredoxin